MKREDLIQQAVLPNSAQPVLEKPIEKRQHERVPVFVEVEVVEKQSCVRAAGRATDLGVGGCYVDTMTTFAEGTPVEVYLHWKGRTLHLLALVSYTMTGRNSGMGLAFTGTSIEEGATLLDWLTSLNGEPSLPFADSQPKTASDGGAKPVRARGLEETIDELVALLVSKRVLSQSEGAALRNRIPK